MERTRNSRLEPMTLTCDLDLELAWLTYGFCTLTYSGEHLTQRLMKIFQKVQEIWSGQEIVTEGQTDGRTDRRTDRWTDV